MKKKDKKLYKYKLMKHYTTLGIYYGYPACCVRDFIKRNDAPSERQSKASNNTGFIPCPVHTRKILSGKIKIEDLIKDRYHPDKFPKDGY